LDRRARDVAHKERTLRLGDETNNANAWLYAHLSLHIVLEADGRFLDASKTYRDKLAFGQAITQGGMGTDVQIGSVIQTQAVGGLRNLRDRFPCGRTIQRHWASAARRKSRPSRACSAHSRAADCRCGTGALPQSSIRTPRR